MILWLSVLPWLPSYSWTSVVRGDAETLCVHKPKLPS